MNVSEPQLEKRVVIKHLVYHPTVYLFMRQISQFTQLLELTMKVQSSDQASDQCWNERVIVRSGRAENRKVLAVCLARVVEPAYPAYYV